MSTRATIHFREGDFTAAIVYRHCDGYPEGLGKDIESFFAEVENQTNDTRFSDASYLAAKWVVWDAEQHANGKPLAFLGVGIVSEDPGDIDYRYILDCATSERPSVTIEEVA